MIESLKHWMVSDCRIMGLNEWLITCNHDDGVPWLSDCMITLWKARMMEWASRAGQILWLVEAVVKHLLSTIRPRWYVPWLHFSFMEKNIWAWCSSCVTGQPLSHAFHAFNFGWRSLGISLMTVSSRPAGCFGFNQLMYRRWASLVAIGFVHLECSTFDGRGFFGLAGKWWI